MKKFYVYIHTCKVNGKKYVGITTKIKPELRWKEGRGYYQNKYFYSAILKYGWNNFEHEVFEVDSEEEMYYAEKYLIAYYHTTESEFGYNHSVGGECSFLGCKHSEKTRKRMSEAKKGKPRSEETKRRMSESHRGKPFSEEHRKHIAEVAKKKAKDPEYRKKLSEILKGKTRSEETKRRISKAAKNRPKTKIKLPDGTVLEITKQNLTKYYINKRKKFEYVS